MKANPTNAEKAFTAILDKNDIYYKFQSYFFTPQKLYIPDFRLIGKNAFFKIIVEIDGSSHDSKKDYDARRTAWLKKERNCQVFRFTNDEVLGKPEWVLEEIKRLDPLTNKDREVQRVRSMPTWRYNLYLKEIGLADIYE